MARRNQTPQQMIQRLREAEVGKPKGRTVAEESWKIGVTEQTLYPREG